MLFITTTIRRSIERELVDHRPDGGEVGVARERRRRPDGDVDEVGARRWRLRPSVVNERRSRVPREQLIETRLVDRHLAASQRLDPLREDVADDDAVAEIGEAGTGDEPDVPGTETAIRLGLGFLAARERRRLVAAQPVESEGLKPFAIAIIVSFESRSRSVFTTQYEASSVRSTTMCSRGPL